jgi:hypothetical protein
MLQQCETYLDISSFFQPKQGEMVGGTARVKRYRRTIEKDIEIVLDCFSGTTVSCGFIRLLSVETQTVRFTVRGEYKLSSIQSGGWLLEPQGGRLSSYWIPQPPYLRRIDAEGHILSQEKAEITGLQVTDEISSVEIRIPSNYFMDLVIWHIPSEEYIFLTALMTQNIIETQTYFIYGSHTSYRRLSDIYLHLIYGSIYENKFSWPKKWKICDELDAYALYLIVRALEHATNKQLYSLIKWQIVFSTLARQADDGGWNHGEWTDSMESHHRLHCGGIHLLLHVLEEEYDEVIRTALDKAVAYLLNCVDHTRFGVWFLHDSLEKSVEKMQQSPFPRIYSHALGKSHSNMLVLNTHIDALIALKRYQIITGDKRFSDLLGSARAATSAVMKLHSAEFMYRWFFKAIYLTLLSDEDARALPVTLRAVKRLTWKYLMPNLHYVKACFPRIVMPGGFIDRALALKGVSFGYQSVSVWDLIRYLRYFPDVEIEKYLAEALHFTQLSPLRRYWKEPKRRSQHALGFWVEALYHLCMRDELPQFRVWLAEVMLDLEDMGLGQPPSLLGANAETSPASYRYPCPSPSEPRLRVANLSRQNFCEILAVNPTNAPLFLLWQDNHLPLMSWEAPDGRIFRDSADLKVPARGWLLGRQSSEYEA